MTDIPEISTAERLHLDPGDVLVVRVDGRVSQAQAVAIKEHVESIIGTAHPILVVDSGITLSVIES